VYRSLSNWLYTQKKRKEGTYNAQPQLTTEQIDLLDELGMDWSLASARERQNWDEHYELLIAFKEEYGHTRVPPRGDWKHLYQWLYNKKRRKHRPYIGSPQLTQEQIDQLDELGIDWNHESLIWDEKYEELKAFKEKFGHTRVPSCEEEWDSLHEWLYRCKKRKNENYTKKMPQLTREQIRKLDELGIDWSINKLPPPRSWDESFAELETFHGVYGHCKVPRNTDPQLFNWVANQKKRLRGVRQPELTDEQIEKLHSVGVKWE